MLLASLRHCLGNLTRFSGRDGRDQFWPYAGVAFALIMLAWVGYFATLMRDMFARMQAFAREHPDQVVVDQGPGHYEIRIEGHHPELMPDFQPALIVISILALVFIVLIAAAAARRLHDSNMTGWIGLVPVVFLFSGLLLMFDTFGAMQRGADPDFGRFFLIFGNNLVYLAGLGGLAYLLARKGTAGDNRYGAPDG